MRHQHADGIADAGIDNGLLQYAARADDQDHHGDAFHRVFKGVHYPLHVMTARGTKQHEGDNHGDKHRNRRGA